ncbi:MAG: energy-coupling factor transporter ATPase [Christensenellaceae bacterium]|nr:energy-coupling factor transporter ATPase [Christensenellaceae bacterium]
MPITTEGLRFEYAPGTPFSHVALEDISVTIDDGSFTSLIGHTGSGKSTFIQLIAGLIKPTAGKIYLDGEDINQKGYDKKKLRRKIGVLFQYPEYQLFEETVEKDIAFGPTKAGFTEDEVAVKVRKAMELVGLDYETFREKSPFELSGGEKRKVAIAGVLATDPQILILDEPIAGLDPIGRQDFMEMVRDLNRGGKTVIMISHNMDDLAEYSTRVIALYQGKVYLDGTPNEVFSRYGHLKRAGLDLPETGKVIQKLRDRGIDIDREIITKDALIRELKKLLGGKDD